MQRAEVLSYIALGANLGDARGTLTAAINSVASLPATRLMATSGLYRTAPIKASGPDFMNAVMAVSTRLTAPELLQHLQQLEALAGRQRPYHNAPRTLDLDILLYGHACISSPALQVPHPRMSERAFVLVPLAEIAPDQVSRAKLSAVASQAIKRVASVW
ncbi:MAG: 2-amino-4-hydroxy-6-hydroxymethyldihydropteridine diphosphokinase [Burkholderiales bacterium RIFOXYD2_FULL_59_8]|nr:MAG: 2-amino-4-hydroxy-6-hydroxymethyldihydropteridine diphosphokinase [Burkholderiales bacterium RIFOXYD12_FULL_59_19]OGB75958.1 MAG: 2-amino-4-hydroxy-6-hydroxymethyldihydropteridine diphosphokinase [Burkholderiales bacterium RIFOXYC12_FULL_60_6]OGB84414.1 MAG: 2-amino-4-hydroxy-6-hydroxymethyldihydropteridine diphosphokinase [Burkholderiales bacterium RIFOXYD2_FULL_59_8]